MGQEFLPKGKENIGVGTRIEYRNRRVVSRKAWEKRYRNS